RPPGARRRRRPPAPQPPGSGGEEGGAQRAAVRGLGRPVRPARTARRAQPRAPGRPRHPRPSEPGQGGARHRTAGPGPAPRAPRLAQGGRARVAQARTAHPDAADRLATTEDTLHAMAAWACLAQNNLTAAREQLAAVRKSPDRGPAAHLRLLEGLLALREGRL